MASDIIVLWGSWTHDPLPLSGTYSPMVTVARLVREMRPPVTRFENPVDENLSSSSGPR